MKTSVARTRRPVAIDLFAGAGGLSLGFESAGFDIVSAVEYDPVHAATHLVNFPLTDVVCSDVSTLSAATLRESARRGWEAHYPGETWDGVIDVVVGGPSCQGFSVLGKQRVDDERNQLVLEFVRVVSELRPRAFCMENVPGFLDARFDGIRSEALERLQAAGYQVSGEKNILRAEDFGVPQKRRRVMILGVRDIAEAPPLPSARAGSPFSVGDAFEGLPQLWRYEPRTETDVLRLSRTGSDRLAAADGAYVKFSGVTEDGGEGLGHRRTTDKTALSGYRSTIHSSTTVERFRATPQGKKEPISRSHRLRTDSPALTLRAGTGRERGSFSATRPLHPTEHRVITVREAARLHSFPDWFKFHSTNWHANRQIGNAVPPLLARAAASALLKALGIAPEKSRLAAIDLGPERLRSMSPSAAARHFAVDDEQVPKRRRAESALSEGGTRKM